MRCNSHQQYFIFSHCTLAQTSIWSFYFRLWKIEQNFKPKGTNELGKEIQINVSESVTLFLSSYTNILTNLCL